MALQAIIIEDDRDAQNIYTRLFRDLSERIRIVSTPEEARALFGDHAKDIKLVVVSTSYLGSARLRNAAVAFISMIHLRAAEQRPTLILANGHAGTRDQYKAVCDHSFTIEIDDVKLKVPEKVREVLGLPARSA
jgi:hypothetical protein